MTTVAERDVALGDGRTLHVYDTGEAADGAPRPVVFWHHGTPNVGEPPEPLFAAAERLGLRWIAYDRPGYGGSTRHEGRDVASVAAEAAVVADALGVGRFAVLGHSGGGPHALACGALLPDRVSAVVSISGLAPLDAFAQEGGDWFAGMHPSGVAELRAALVGPEELESLLVKGDFDPEIFTPEDHTALSAGPWAWFMGVVQRATANGVGGMVDDDLAYVRPWGCDPARIGAPTLVVHGAADRMVPAAHGAWLAGRCPGAEWWERPGQGHVSVLSDAAEEALAWMAARIGGHR
ncbi:alpha/beta fold hydrolase [Streptacidiphilus neutrinimicus]|uniref:alpha/beta fold hydrolase n=1 Tax=Streptacidiphilus neutrinimicus TaxID=105420 RepID=UPI0005AAD3C9|nr:alpha/beta hydrolase [Streptacidiphilus neutrinimicus]